MKSITQLLFNYMLYSRSKDYMFRPVVAIIRSMSLDTLTIIYIIVWRPHNYKRILSVLNDKDLMMATTGRNM